MSGNPWPKAVNRFLIVLAVVVPVVAAVAYLRAAQYESLWVSFKDTMFIGGLFVMFVGGVVGAGFTHNRYYKSGMYKVSGNYMHAVNDDRLARRQSELYFMLLCLAVGGAMVVLPYIIP